MQFLYRFIVIMSMICVVIIDSTYLSKKQLSIKQKYRGMPPNKILTEFLLILSFNSTHSQQHQETTTIVTNNEATLSNNKNSLSSISAKVSRSKQRLLCNYETPRKDCGQGGISRSVCLNRGCCWDHRSRDTVWCFHPQNNTNPHSKRNNELRSLSPRSGVTKSKNESEESTTALTSGTSGESATVLELNPTEVTTPQKQTGLSRNEQAFLSQLNSEYHSQQTEVTNTSRTRSVHRTSHSTLTYTTPTYTSPFRGKRFQTRATPIPVMSSKPTVASAPTSLLQSLRNLEEFAALLSFLENIEKSRKKLLTPSRPSRVCPIGGENSCCKIDPTSPCCEFKKERTAVRRSSPALRIVGGSPAGLLRRSVAHIAKLPFRNHICGGTLISHRWVLTAAHCVLTYCHRLRHPSELIVSLGKYRKSPHTYDVGEQTKLIANVICHPNQCKSSTLTPRLNDVALLRLRSPASINRFVQPALMPSPHEEPIPSRNCFALGWGRTRGSGYSNVLKQVSVPIIPNGQCNQQAWRDCIVRGCMLCAGDINIDPCDGDSGGPLFCPRHNGVYVLHGVYSWGRCGTEVRKPSVYSRAPYFLDWIDKVTRTYSWRFK